VSAPPTLAHTRLDRSVQAEAPLDKTVIARILLLVVVIALVVACGDDRLTPEAYVVAYCETYPHIDPGVDGETIGEARQELERRAAGLAALEPPRDAQAFHEALIEFLTIYVSALAESGDGQDPFPQELDSSPDTERRMAIAYAAMTLEYVSLPQPFIDLLEDCGA